MAGAGIATGTVPDGEDPERSLCVLTWFTWLTSKYLLSTYNAYVLAVQGLWHMGVDRPVNRPFLFPVPTQNACRA